MNQDDIPSMAREAGFYVDENGDILEGDNYSIQTDLIKRFAALVAAHERMNTNNAYKERNQLVGLLSTLFPSGKAKTAIEGWDEAWHGCVYIDFPWGQASWHYHTDDEWMFSHLPPYTKEWDGHTTEAKYAAIASAIGARGNVREHTMSGDCWCNPELNYTDPETGTEVWVHKEPQ